LKNFALLESTSGDYLMSPVYDLINTQIHVDDNDFALDKDFFQMVSNQKQRRKKDMLQLQTSWNSVKGSG